MATTAWIAAMRKKPKYAIRIRNRCKTLRPCPGLHAQVPDVPDLFPEPDVAGLIPGVTKSSW